MVDYLMITVVVSAVMIPIINRFFGDAIVGQLFAQRQQLVSFVAQTPKRPVSNIWFAAERSRAITTNKVNGGNQVDTGNVNDPGQDIQTGGNINTNQVNASGQSGGGGQINASGSVGGGDTINGGRNVGTGQVNTGGGGSGLKANSNLNDGFLNGGGGGGAGDGDADGGSAKNGFGKGGGAYGDLDTGDITTGSGSRKGSKGGSEATTDEAKKTAEMARRQSVGVSQLEKEEAERSSAFDWWMLIKFLILLAIIALLILIALSNLKRTR